jgi:hypothetical protein
MRHMVSRRCATQCTVRRSRENMLSKVPAAPTAVKSPPYAIITSCARAQQALADSKNSLLKSASVLEWRAWYHAASASNAPFRAGAQLKWRAADASSNTSQPGQDDTVGRMWVRHMSANTPSSLHRRVNGGRISHTAPVANKQRQLQKVTRLQRVPAATHAPIQYAQFLGCASGQQQRAKRGKHAAAHGRVQMMSGQSKT